MLSGLVFGESHTNSYLFHGSFTQLILGNVMNVVHLEQRVSLKILHKALLELVMLFSVHRPVVCPDSTYQSRLFATVQKMSQFADSKGSLCALLIHAGHWTVVGR